VRIVRHGAGPAAISGTGAEGESQLHNQPGVAPMQHFNPFKETAAMSNQPTYAQNTMFDVTAAQQTMLQQADAGPGS